MLYDSACHDLQSCFQKHEGEIIQAVLRTGIFIISICSYCIRSRDYFSGDNNIAIHSNRAMYMLPMLPKQSNMVLFFGEKESG